MLALIICCSIFVYIIFGIIAGVIVRMVLNWAKTDILFISMFWPIFFIFLVIWILFVTIPIKIAEKIKTKKKGGENE